VDGERAKVARGLAVVAEHVRDLRRIGWGTASAALLVFGRIILANVGLSTR
jgi:hypothetical protein